MPGTASRDHCEPFCSVIRGRSASVGVPHSLHAYPATRRCPSRATLTLASRPEMGLNATTYPGELGASTATRTPARVRAARVRAAKQRRTTCFVRGWADTGGGLTAAGLPLG